MNNLTKQLANLYEPKWKELKQQLDVQDIKVQSPFMLGVALERNNQGGYVDESWWTDADLKVMVFGKEPNICQYHNLRMAHRFNLTISLSYTNVSILTTIRGSIFLQTQTTSWLRIISLT